MMKTTSIALAAMVSATMATTTFAGDREWATTGKVLTGVVAGAIVLDALRPPPPMVVVQQQPVYVQQLPPPTIVYAPAPPPAVIYGPARPAVVYVESVPVIEERIVIRGGIQFREYRDRSHYDWRATRDYRDHRHDHGRGDVRRDDRRDDRRDHR